MEIVALPKDKWKGVPIPMALLLKDTLEKIEKEKPDARLQ